MYAKLSKEIARETKIAVDGIFITEFMPHAPESYVKVYLLGLSLACSDTDNSPEQIATTLGMDINLVFEAFSYWADYGVVNLLSTNPPTVEFLPVTRNSLSLRKFSKTKYKDFNDQLHAMFPSRNILPNEYNEYYTLMETLHVEPTALLAIISYSIRLKGESVTYPYICAVARNLANQGCLTYERVMETLGEFDGYDDDLAGVYKSLGTKKASTLEDKRMLKKWLKEWGFALETVIAVAKTIKKGGMDKLDLTLKKYYENHLFSTSEITAFMDNRERLLSLTKSINRIIGVYYEQVDFIIETYVSKWLGYGFDDETLLSIAEYCFKRNVRNLEGMNETVEKFYRQGLLSQADIGAFMSEASRKDAQIRALLDSAGVSRPINSRDRDAYRTWTYTWKMPDEVISYCATLAQGNANPIAYINSVLSSWKNAGVDTVEKAKNFRSGNGGGSAVTPTVGATVVKTYTTEELNAMFDNLDYEDL
ncbi:MAG: DnaD domain protein [Clostridia bacterium]|nr:DnaD domain protein [Clostridia bacterium]